MSIKVYATQVIQADHPGRQLPAMYPDRGRQFDQVAILNKLGLTQAEFVFLCRAMIRDQLSHSANPWPFQTPLLPKD